MSQRGIIAAEDPDECEICGAFEELRPYGPNKERICYGCGMKDRATTEKMMDAYLFGQGELQ
jgi:hypothetical protein